MKTEAKELKELMEQIEYLERGVAHEANRWLMLMEWIEFKRMKEGYYKDEQ